ncbi:hypothetical protein TrVFT333_005685 [Trichoderma virens FT-333]|nr:hypothetical protein TrVFT333_005685 [Trichoderma virens FT-333]
MQQLSQLVAFTMLATSALAGPLQPRESDNHCFTNEDTAWWKPPGDVQTRPTDTVRDICSWGGSGGCQYGYGHLCVLGDLNYCGGLISALESYQNFTDDRWEFPSVIQCGHIALSVASFP